MEHLSEQLQQLRGMIAEMAKRHGRDPAEVELLAVSKRHPVAAIRTLVAAGQRAFGENYVSEAVEKIASLDDDAIEWHFIGPIQSNKTGQIARHFSWVHSVDRAKLLQRLSKQRPTQLMPLNVCLQIHIGDESSKSGAPPEQALELARLAEQLPGIKLRGLMCIPPPSKQPKQQRHWFAQLRELRDELAADGIALDTLSMGMSNDLESAIAEGATMVRVGTALFGQRPPP